MENDSPEQVLTKDSNKFYFLILCIVALLGSNIYVYVNGKKSDDKIITLTDEKSRMEIEIDRIEAELDRTKNSYLDLSTELKEGQEVARLKITELRTQLKQGKLTQQQLARAQKEIKDLKSFVSTYTANIKKLENKNVSLEIQRDSLQTTVANINERTSILEKENSDLNAKVKVAAALKIANIVVSAVRLRKNGKESEVTRASTAGRIKVRFTIADNALATKTTHDIFMRIIDPNGNLLIADGGSLFTANDDEMQYTYKTTIDFDNTYGKLFSIDWDKTVPFQKGEYAIILYADGYTVGKVTIALR
ncbi:hypothetical protein [Arcticibacter eurypsychrophilus]|uniref:hypothetical protein n=1 Tax=Arcticibacter eurypsychrophilus TaxID=1434752 RepID=UPI00084D99B6|nr:hypothetical protein [Arcticibacter eurypsychrophilus]